MWRNAIVQANKRVLVCVLFVLENGRAKQDMCWGYAVTQGEAEEEIVGKRQFFLAVYVALSYQL